MSEAQRSPYLRRPGDAYTANLPEGKTCGDCAHMRRCGLIYGRIEADEVCDWVPSRFTPAAGGAR